MKKREWAFALAFFLALAGPSEALEIYRVGGEDLARPDTVEGINFHQLSWSDYRNSQGLDEALLQEGVLRPIFVGPEDDVAKSSVDRGGGPLVRVSGVVSYSVTAESESMLDGDPSTYYTWPGGVVNDKFSVLKVIQTRRVTMDLGGRFFINRVRIIAGVSGSYPDGLRLFANDVVQGKDTVSGYGASVSTGIQVLDLPENVEDTIDVTFPAVLTRSLDLILLRSSPRAVLVGEIQIFGEGFTKEAFYEGPFIDLGQAAVWGNLRWRGREDTEAKVRIQTRAGRDKDPNVYWRFTGRGSEISPLAVNGKELDKLGYALLKPGEGAGTTYDMQNWSFWTAPYDFADSSGTSIVSPAPNSVFQLQVDFLPTIKGGGDVEFIEFSATIPPLAEEVVGEIFPIEVALGEETQFTYALRPTIRAEDDANGFDQIEISAPFGVSSIDTVRLFGVPIDVEARFESADSTYFSIALPQRLGAGDSGGVIEVVFTAPVLRYGTTFGGWIRDTERPLELPQRIVPGDAAIELVSEELTVRTTLSDRLLADLQVEPRKFAPNGDGINDRVRFAFNLLQLTNEAPLNVRLFDLSGRLLKVVHDGGQESGKLNFFWDGRDESGALVAPGIYLYRIEIEAEEKNVEQFGTVAVVY